MTPVTCRLLLRCTRPVLLTPWQGRVLAMKVRESGGITGARRRLTDTELATIETIFGRN